MDLGGGPPPYGGQVIEYRPWGDIGYKIAGAALAFGVGGLGLWIAGRSPTQAFNLIFTAGACVVGLLLALSALNTRIVLGPSAIEVYGLLGSRRMLRRDIVGYRRYTPSRSRPYLLLRSRDPAGPTFRLDASVLTSAQCRPWFEGVEDLKASDEAAVRAAIDADAALGATVQARRAAALRIRVLLAVLLAAGVGVLFFGLSAAGAGLPFLVALLAYLLACLAGAFFVPPLPADPGGSTLLSAGRLIFVYLLWPPAFGAIAATNFLHLANVNDALTLGAAALALGVLIAFAALGRLPSPDGRSLQAFAVAAGAAAVFLYGLGMEADAAADPSAPTVTPAEVVNLYVSRGRSTTYHAVFASEAGRIDDAVPYSLYGSLTVGGQACLAYHPGLLSLRWYRIERC